MSRVGYNKLIIELKKMNLVSKPIIKMSSCTNIRLCKLRLIERIPSHVNCAKTLPLIKPELFVGITEHNTIKQSNDQEKVTEKLHKSPN